MLMKIRKAVKRKDNQKGFTLIELIVVMAILAVLLALAIPRFTGVLSDSKDNADNANLKMIEKAGELWYANQESTPATDTTFEAPTVDSDFVPNYLKEWPVVPNNSAEHYKVVITTDGDVSASSAEAEVTP